MAKTGKPERSDSAPRRRPEGGGRGRRPERPQGVEAEQTREAEESRRAHGADASKSVKKGHTGGR